MMRRDLAATRAPATRARRRSAAGSARSFRKLCCSRHRISASSNSARIIATPLRAAQSREMIMMNSYTGKFVVFLNALLIATCVFAQAKTDDRDALRALLVKGSEALNTRNFDAIAPSMHSGFTIVTVDNKKFVGLDEFKKHYNALFEGDGAILTKVEVKLEADEATRLLDPTTGVVYGTSNDTYHFKDGDVRTMKTRWSAVTKKEGGTWKIVNVHFSTDLFDNPVLGAAKSYAKKLAICGAIAGLVVGFLLMALMRRKS